MKRIFAFLMAIVFVLSAVPIVLTSALSNNGFTYEVVDGGAEITGFVNSTTAIVIPDTLGGYPVTAIGDYAFANRLDNKGADMTSLSLPSTLERIGEGAFTTNAKISSLTIPASVTEIGDRAFLCWVNLSSLSIPGKGDLLRIGKWAFRNCISLSRISLPNSLDAIEEGAFSYCASISSVTIPESVRRVEREAFLGCTSLSSAVFENEQCAIGENVFDLTSVSPSNSAKRGLMISGYENSTAQKFASLENFGFNKIESASSEDGAQEETAGDYFIKVSYTVIGSNSIKANYGGFNKEVNDSAGISVLYRDINGTVTTEKEQKFDIKSSLSATGNYSVNASISGFPRLLYCYLDDNLVGSQAGFKVTKLEVGSSESDLKTVWTGEMQVRSQFKAYGASVDWNNNIKINYFKSDDNTFVKNSSGAFDKPYAKTFNCAFEKESMSFSKSTYLNFNGYSYSAKDQYNVSMSNSLCTLSYTSSIGSNNQYISLKTNEEDGNKRIVEIKNDAHLLSENRNSQTISVTASWAGVSQTKSNTTSFTLYDEKYDVLWIDENDGILNSDEVYYGDKANFALPEKEADETNHYLVSSWNPAPAQITKDTSYYAVYTPEAHNFEVTSHTDASCTTDGNTVYNCSECGYEKTVTEASTGHSYKSVVTPATCGAQGYTTYTCEKCGDSYTDDFTPTLEHSYYIYESEEPTCTTKGGALFYCPNCGDSYTVWYDELGHDFGEWSTKTEPTCTAKGLKQRDCSRCDAIDTEEIEPLGHNFGEWEVKTKPACNAKGLKQRDCSRCDAFETEEIGATGHNYIKNHIEPTCTERGYDEYTCEYCSDVFKDDFVSAIGHDYSVEDANENTLRTAADETHDATYYYTCSHCAQADTETYFTLVQARISGKVDMDSQYKDIIVNLIKEDKVIETKTLEAGSSGEFSFFALEDGEYSIAFFGENTTDVSIMTVEASAEKPVVLTDSENQEVSLIEISNGDLNKDGVVDISDISILLAQGSYGNTDAFGRVEDIDNNGKIDVWDLSIILIGSNYGSTSKTISAG